MRQYKHYIWLLACLFWLSPVVTEGQSLILTGNEVLMQDELSFPQDSTRVRISPKSGSNYQKTPKSAGQQFTPSNSIPANKDKTSPSQQTKPEKPVPVYPPTISARAFTVLTSLFFWLILTLWKLLM
ncbi:MAG: hypothetical protein KatS3mg033_1573 [Thermonema sp.]|uniref:hypothetical protein n=1 Tax=Thermonema sp. TaxID=2231181 RepID=UPI0021DC0719|nr:hypothetical protein [Thermonema sp.]GIV39773.1 MAG: hypothetical protein KatS3mg033_1573 [Thermonema sp.]